MVKIVEGGRLNAMLCGGVVDNLRSLRRMSELLRVDVDESGVRGVSESFITLEMGVRMEIAHALGLSGGYADLALRTQPELSSRRFQPVDPGSPYEPIAPTAEERGMNLACSDARFKGPGGVVLFSDPDAWTDISSGTPPEILDDMIGGELQTIEGIDVSAYPDLRYARSNSFSLKRRLHCGLPQLSVRQVFCVVGFDEDGTPKACWVET